MKRQQRGRPTIGLRQPKQNLSDVSCKGCARAESESLQSIGGAAAVRGGVGCASSNSESCEKTRGRRRVASVKVKAESSSNSNTGVERWSSRSWNVKCRVGLAARCAGGRRPPSNSMVAPPPDCSKSIKEKAGASAQAWHPCCCCQGVRATLVGQPNLSRASGV